MDAAERAIARGRAYDLLADLVQHGPRRVDHLRAVFGSLLDGDPDELAAEHHRVFGREVPPFASPWFHPEGLLGGEPDHLSETLRGLVQLAGAEADAINDGQTAELERMRALSTTTLADKLLRWLPPFRAAVARTESPLYDSAIGMLLALVIEHATALDALPAAWTLPELTKASTAVTLATPCRSGMLWTYTALGRIAREAEIPCGLRSRVEILETLLGEGTRFGVLPRVVAGLMAEVDAVVVALPDTLRPAAQPFVDRLAETRTLLAGLVP